MQIKTIFILHQLLWVKELHVKTKFTDTENDLMFTNFLLSKKIIKQDKVRL